MFKRPFAIILLCLLTFLIPIEHIYNKFFRFYSLTLIPKGLSLPAHFYKKIYFYPSDWIALCLCFLGLFAFKVPLTRFFFHKGAIYLWIVFIFSFLSLTTSPFALYPIPYTHLWHLATPFLFFCFIANALPFEDRSKATRLMLACLLLAALIQSGLAIAQYTIQGSLGLRHLFGEPNVFALIPVPGGRRWIFDAATSWEIQSIIRPSGTMGHANVLGRFLGASLLASYPFFECAKQRRILYFCFPLLFFSMMLTFSRSALFGWILGTMAWFGLAAKQNGWRFTLLQKTTKAIGFSIAISCFLSVGILHEQILSRGGIVNYNNVSRSADLERIHWQNSALKIIQKHPLLGCGFEQIPVPVHNMYLYLAAETGLFALFAFFFFIAAILRIAIQTPYTPFIGALFGMFVASLFIGGCEPSPPFAQAARLLFFLPACLIALQKEQKVLNISQV